MELSQSLVGVETEGCGEQQESSYKYVDSQRKSKNMALLLNGVGIV